MLVVEHKPEAIAIADHVVDLGPRAGSRRRRGRVRGNGRRAARERHAHRPAPRRPRAAQGRRCARANGALEVRGADRAQPAGGGCRHPARRARRRDRGGGVGQELAHPRVGGAARRRRGRRPGRDPRVAAQQPRDLHGDARADPQGVRQGQRREARAVQRELRGRLPELQRRRRHLHRPRRDGGRLDRLRGVRGATLRRVGARVHAGRTRHQRGARRCRSPKRSSSSRRARRSSRRPTPS